MRLGVASRQLDVSHGCGGAAPFAPFTGSGSGGDQSQYAPGGQWTQYAQGVVVPAGLARMPPSNADETRAVTAAPVARDEAPQVSPAFATRDEAPEVSPALARGQDMHGCGGAAPFASFAGGGSGIASSSKWAPGGQWTTRSGANVPSAVERMEATAANAEEGAPRASRHLSPALAVGQDLHGCGGAAPFAPFAGSGSVGDQSQYAPGGQWTR